MFRFIVCHLFFITKLFFRCFIKENHLILTSNRVAHRSIGPAKRCTICIAVTLVSDPESFGFFCIPFYSSMGYRHAVALHTNQIDSLDAFLCFLLSFFFFRHVNSHLIKKTNSETCDIRSKAMVAPESCSVQWFFLFGVSYVK